MKLTELDEDGALESHDKSAVRCHEVSLETNPNLTSQVTGADEMEVQLDFQKSYYDLYDVEMFLRLLKKDLEYNVLESNHVLVRNLKEMDIWVLKLSEIPINLSFPNLEKLFLYTNSDSKNISNSFFKGRHTVHYPNLDLSYIPPSFFERMPALKELNLTNSCMKILPPSIVKLMKLETLILKGCKHLMEIPHDIGKLRTLKELDLSGCKSLVKLSETIRKLRFLNKLNLSGCEHLMEIPDNIDTLFDLRELDLSGCIRLDKLPESISKFSFIEMLNLSDCGIFSETFIFPPSLYTLDLADCKQLTKLPESISTLKYLEKLNLSGCTNLAEIPDLKLLERLSSLDLTDCKSLTEVPESVCRLQFLKYLSLSGCENLATFPESFGNLEKLSTLQLKDCKGLTKLPESLGTLKDLQVLNLHGCSKLAEIPDSIKSLKRLTSLNVTDCISLTTLPESISEIPVLRQIKLLGCSSLFMFRGSQVSIKCLSWNIGEPDRKQVELEFHQTQGTPSDITEILGLMEKVLKHQLLKSKELVVAVIKLKVIHKSNSKVPEIPKNLCFPDLEKLVLQPNFDFSSINSSFFKQMPAFKVLDMSHTHIKTLPSCVYELTDLKGLILQRCELLMELSDSIGALENLELLDLEGTNLVCLPYGLKKLTKLKYLKVSLYDAENYRKSNKIVDIIPKAVLSELTELEELNINIDPQDVWCGALVKAIIADLLSLRKLKILKLYLPTTELLQNLVKLKSNEDDLSIYQNLSNFVVIIGPYDQRFISRLPCDLEEEYLKLKKCLKYTCGKDYTSELAEALKHANALYLDRHWNIQNLSIFKADKLNKLNFCMLVDCNDMQTVFDASDFNLEDNVLSLQYLAIHYLRNLEVIWKGPGAGSGCCLQSLKVLVLHMCPNLTTIFTTVLLGYLLNLQEIIVEDCPKITSLIAEDSTQLTGTEYLPSIRKISLLYLPELESISSGISIGPKLENIVIYDCPKLKRLPSLRMRNEKVIKIKGESEWWNALEWIGGRPPYLDNAFCELDVEEDFLDGLGTQYVNSLRLFVEECNAN